MVFQKNSMIQPSMETGFVSIAASDLLERVRVPRQGIKPQVVQIVACATTPKSLNIELADTLASA